MRNDMISASAAPPVKRMQPPPPPHKPFPLRAVVLASLLPALIGAISSLFVPPLVSHDTSYGLIAWFNYIRGGQWNTLSTLDPSNITQSIEVPLAWWPPGQYVPLGLLHSLGIPLGIGIVIIGLLSALILGTGIAKLAHTLGASARSVPWAALGVTFSHYTLSTFSYFIGGELVIIALWPWTCLIAWKLRSRYLLLSISLPILFLLGSYAKHSFAICALVTLGFLWIEALRDQFTTPPKQRHAFKHLTYTSIALLAAGLIYILGRKIIIPTGISPAESVGQALQPTFVSWGFSFLAPILELTGIDRVVGLISYRFFNTPAAEELFPRLGALLAVLSLLPLILYLRLSSREKALDRLTGITALLFCTVFFFFYWKAGIMGLRTRYYQPIATLLTALLAEKCFDTKPLWAIGSRLIFAGVITFGGTLLFYRTITMTSDVSHYYRASEHLTSVDAPPQLIAQLRDIAASPNSVIFVDGPWLELELLINAAPTTRFFSFPSMNHWHPEEPKHGRVPRLVLPISKRLAEQGVGEKLRKSFIDYREEEWSLTVVEDWQIWQASE